MIHDLGWFNFAESLSLSMLDSPANECRLLILPGGYQRSKYRRPCKFKDERIKTCETIGAVSGVIQLCAAFCVMKHILVFSMRFNITSSRSMASNANGANPKTIGCGWTMSTCVLLNKTSGKQLNELLMMGLPGTQCRRRNTNISSQVECAVVSVSMQSTAQRRNIKRDATHSIVALLTPVGEWQRNATCHQFTAILQTTMFGSALSASFEIQRSS